MELVEIIDAELCDPELSDRHQRSSKNAFTHHYVAKEDEIEVEFSSVDFGNELDEHFIIYEIFVPVRLRRRGIGQRLLQAAEGMARTLNYATALLIPRALDHTAFGQAELEAWYSRQGYIQLANSGANALVKELSK